MGVNSDQGQALIECLICALFILGFFLLTVSLGDAAKDSLEQARFAKQRSERRSVWTKQN